MSEYDPLNPPSSRGTKAGVLVLDAPVAPDALPLEADDRGHKIPVFFQSTGLRVEVPTLWPGSNVLDPGDITLVKWFFEADMFDEKRLTAPYDASDLPDVDALVPPHLMDVPGLHRLRYEVILRESSGNPGELSFSTILDSDKVGPNNGLRGPRFQFPQVIEDDGVTDEYLDNPANLDRVTATIDLIWPDIRLGDVVEASLIPLPFLKPLRKRPRHLDIVATTTIVQAHKDGVRPIEVHFPGAFLRGLPNREFNAQYYLKDRSGRESGPSRTAPLLINLTPTPTDLDPVQIPQLNDGRIALNDARAEGGVYMNILEVFGSTEGDRLLPSWDLIPLDPIVISAFQVWPIRVPIPYSVLASGGYEFVSGIVRAEYSWQRGVAPSRPSITRFAPVDLTVAGPVSPNNPNPINLLLDVVTVKGVDGDNQLTINDEGKPVRVITSLYGAPDVGQTLELMAGSFPGPIATYTVQAGDSAGREIEWFVDWNIIELLDTGWVPFFYWTFNGVNRQRAPDTPVMINTVPIVGLKPLEYVGVNYGPGPDAGFISCHLRPWVNGAGVKIPGDPTLLDGGDEVILHWASYAHPNGFAGAVIPDTIKSFSHTLTEQEAREGYVFQVPFDPYILLPGLIKPPEGQTNPRHGSAVARYQIIKPAGAGMGYSERNLVFIRLIRPNSPPCVSDD
ncbi:hypothetical protein [Pseudomonas sp. Root569]|uniref:hypothetical protein n=1 Tax=Pseudomonas sp. Root569 TaxID=1736566 RepID=UPI00070301B1|nr:hypothetical protein [Pseudomonas sp. Root569]KRA08332.1 hypothetical protein ASD70_10600 [Pseudomonas sp. Root569]